MSWDINGRKLQRIFTVIKNKTNMPITPLLFFKIHGVLTRLIRQIKEGNDINSIRKDVK